MSAASLRTRLLVGLTFAMATLGLDLLTKHIAAVLLTGNPITLAGPLNLQLELNPGDVLFPHAMSQVTVTLVHLTLIGVVAAAALLVPSRTAAVGSGLVMGGTLGNWVNLIQRPHLVVDFLGFGSWQVFNVADFAVVIGVVVVVIAALRLAVATRRSPATPTVAAVELVD
jgi:signal peptidase II